MKGKNTWLIKDHLPQVTRIDRLMFIYSWGPMEFQRFLRKRNIIGRVLLKEDSSSDIVLGYYLYKLGKDDTEIIRLATAPDAIRRGVGRLMVSDLQRRLNSHFGKRKKIFRGCERN